MRKRLPLPPCSKTTIVSSKSIQDDVLRRITTHHWSDLPVASSQPGTVLCVWLCSKNQQRPIAHWQQLASIGVERQCRQSDRYTLPTSALAHSSSACAVPYMAKCEAQGQIVRMASSSEWLLPSIKNRISPTPRIAWFWCKTTTLGMSCWAVQTPHTGWSSRILYHCWRVTQKSTLRSQMHDEPD